MNKTDHTGRLALILAFVMLMMGAAENNFPGAAGKSLSGPASGVVTITQSDTVSNTYVSRGLRCEAAGTISYLCVDGSTGAESVQAGQLIPAQIERVNDTGTSLTDAEMTGYR